MASNKSTQEIAKELQVLVVDYAKQETIDPLKNLGRYLGFGIGGSLVLGTGIFLLLLALLRALQGAGADRTENGELVDGWFTGAWSWAPYVIVALVGLMVIAAFAQAIAGRSGKTGAERTEPSGSLS